MGILSRAGDLVYTYRFLKLLTTDFKDTKAYELGLIDQKGKKIKQKYGKILSDEEKSAYTPFHRLVFNIKRLIPAGKVGSYAAALYLLKEEYIKNEDKIAEVLEEHTSVDSLSFVTENTNWFIVNENQIAPGIYRIRHSKIINGTLEELVQPNDRIVVAEGCNSPVGSIFGLDVYEAQHAASKQTIYVTVGELYK